MSEQLSYDLVSPEALVASGEAHLVVVPGSEGQFGVMAKHAPFMSTLQKGVLEVRSEHGVEARYFVDGGFADVSPMGLTVLAEFAQDLRNVNADDLDVEIQSLKTQFESSEGDAKDLLHRKLHRLEALRSIL